MEWMILPLKRYADFNGRSQRMEYWMFYLFNFLIGIVFAILTTVLGGTAAIAGNESTALAAGGAVGVISIAQLIVNLGLLIPTLAVSVRRLHDTDRSGWWLLAPLAGLPVFLIGLAGTGISVLQPGGTPNFGGMFAILAIGGLLTLGFGIMVFVFTCLDGTRGPNRFGPDPKDPNGDLETVFS
jgi:uncharacterized membrane protein YhaH (DUF805 family)